MELVSSLPFDQCCRALQAAMDRPLTFRGRRPVIGWLDGSELRARKRTRYGNSFQTHLSAKITDAGGKTLIRCQTAMHPLIIGVFSVWFCGVMLLSCTAIILSLMIHAVYPPRSAHGLWVEFVFPTAVPIVSLAVLKFGQHLARDDGKFLIAFLSMTLGANPNEA